MSSKNYLSKGDNMHTDSSAVNSIDICGNYNFYSQTKGIISNLQDSGMPVDIRVSDNSYNKGFKDSIEDDGIITIELTKPKNGIKTGLFCVTNEIESNEPIINKFQLHSSSSELSTVVLTFSMKHSDFNCVLKKEIEELIGDSL